MLEIIQENKGASSQLNTLGGDLNHKVCELINTWLVFFLKKSISINLTLSQVKASARLDFFEDYALKPKKVDKIFMIILSETMKEYYGKVYSNFDDMFVIEYVDNNEKNVYLVNKRWEQKYIIQDLYEDDETFTKQFYVDEEEVDKKIVVNSLEFYSILPEQVSITKHELSSGIPAGWIRA